MLSIITVFLVGLQGAAEFTIIFMFLASLLDLIFPSLCLNCRRNVRSGEVICRECFNSPRLNQTLFCGKCRARLPDGKKICHQDFPYVLGAATNYDDAVIKNLIQSLKFKFIKNASSPMGNILALYWENLALPFQNLTVVPMPLSQKRLRERGFNQSELIAKVFSEQVGLVLETACLVRTKNTKPQSETHGLSERLENVRECFAVKNPELLYGKNILLIDDVTTSGATLLEAARVLKNAGVKKIIALAAAKA